MISYIPSVSFFSTQNFKGVLNVSVFENKTIKVGCLNIIHPYNNY